MRERHHGADPGLFDVELHEPGPEQLQQLVELPRSEHLEHFVVQLVVIDAVQLELVLVVVLDGIEQLLQLELLVRRRWQLEQLQLVLVGRLGSPGHALTIGV